MAWNADGSTPQLDGDIIGSPGAVNLRVCRACVGWHNGGRRRDNHHINSNKNPEDNHGHCSKT